MLSVAISDQIRGVIDDIKHLLLTHYLENELDRKSEGGGENIVSPPLLGKGGRPPPPPLDPPLKELGFEFAT